MERKSIEKNFSELEVYIYPEYHTDGLIIIAKLLKDRCLERLINTKYTFIENYVKNLGISVIYSECSYDRKIREITNRYNTPLKFLDEGYEPMEKLKTLSHQIFFDENKRDEYLRLINEIREKRKDERENYWVDKIKREHGKVLVICGESHTNSLLLKLRKLGIKVFILESAEKLYEEGDLKIC